MRIGVFDSGIGGLTVLREIRRACPGHSTLYLGDTARVPYGSKSADTVRRYALACADFLLRQGIDYLVVACNTASAFALESLAELRVPVSGVIEPGAELAARTTRTGRIGVIGTSGTIRSGAYERAIHRRDSRFIVDSIACPLFVPIVEEGWEESDIARATAKKYLSRWIADPANAPDAVVLGCTHYPILKSTLREVLGEKITLIDSAETVANHVKSEIANGKVEAAPTHRLFLTDASESFTRFAKRYLAGTGTDATLEPEWVDLEIGLTQRGSLL